MPGDDDYARYFRELLHEVVRDYCGNSDLLACQMSGGMDSTTITSIAQKWQRKRGKRCLAVSHYYRNDPNSDESKLIEDMRQFLLPDVFHFQEVIAIFLLCIRLTLITRELWCLPATEMSLPT